MAKRETDVAGATDRERRPGGGRSRRRGGRGLALGGRVCWQVLALGSLVVARSVAQIQAARLSIRPHEIKGAEWTGPAGDIPLASLPEYSLYVPQSCTGTSRCPLLVVASDMPKAGHGMPQTMLGWQRPVADKYGMIVLVLDAYSPRGADSVPSGGADLGVDTRRLDAALTQALQKFAVDPDRIALLGYNSAPAEARPPALRNSWLWAVQNLDVFSRVVMSAIVTTDSALPLPATAPPPRPPQFLLTAEAFATYADVDVTPFSVAQALRRQGYPAELLFSLKSGGRGVWEDFDFIGRWLRDSWADVAVARPAARAGVASGASPTDSRPRLTTEAIDRLGQFWASFQQEPDSIWRVGRRAHLREVVLPIDTGAARPRTWVTDMVALAAQYPSVAAKLKAAGLTAREHDAYRLALLSAYLVRALGNSAAAVVVANSVLAANAAFLEAHKEDTAFSKAFYSESLVPAGTQWLVSGMWQTP